MKKLLFLAVAAFTIVTLSQSCKKKVSDADAQTALNTELAKMTDTKGATAVVKDGVATITGECKDQACSDKCKAAAEALKVDGVKSIDWKCTIAPVIASLTTTLDAATQQKVKDGLKDLAGLTLQGFSAKGAIINGTTNLDGKKKLMQMLANAKVLLDVASKITMK